MTHSLVYVERKMILSICAKLLGSSLSKRDSHGKTAGFDWFFEASYQFQSEKSHEMKISDLFPEDAFNFAYEKILHKEFSIKALCESIQKMQLKSADVISVNGKLELPSVEMTKNYNPFDPPEIPISKYYTIFGEKCFIGQLTSNGFKMPVYFLENSKEYVYYCDQKPVEIVGVLKWSPSYEVGGSMVNQIILAAALLLQR